MFPETRRDGPVQPDLTISFANFFALSRSSSLGRPQFDNRNLPRQCQLPRTVAPFCFSESAITAIILSLPAGLAEVPNRATFRPVKVPDSMNFIIASPGFPPYVPLPR